MAKKIATSASLTELKKGLEKKNMIVGTKEVLKNLRLGKLAKIFIASNCEENSKKDIIHYSNLEGVEVVELKNSNIEIGVICKKHYSISALGISKA